MEDKNTSKARWKKKKTEGLMQIDRLKSKEASETTGRTKQKTEGAITAREKSKTLNNWSNN